MKSARFVVPVLVAAAILAAGCPSRGGEYERRRQAMVANQIVARGIRDPKVIAAMSSVPRHRFVPPELRAAAYADGPVPIGAGQTISQPYIVALMTESLALRGGERVLEIGTGSGYQAAVLAAIVDTVYTIEIVPELAARAAGILDTLGYRNVRLRAGDGYEGWPEGAPFDAVIVTAAAPRLPEPLVAQLRVGGRIVVPIGDELQELEVYEKKANGLSLLSRVPVRFVPMTGKIRE